MEDSEPKMSIYAELATAYEASLQSNKTSEISFGFKQDSPEEKDFHLLADLLEANRITMEGFFYLYSVAMKFMQQALGKWGEQYDKDLLDDETKRIVMTMLPVALQPELIVTGDSDRTFDEFLPMVGSLMELMATNEDFVMRVIDRAFNDAVVVHIRESVRTEIRDGGTN